MADFGVFIGFGFPARGREEAATKVFGELMQYLVGEAGQGRIEGFEPAFIQPHGGDLGGFILVRGDRAKLDQMVASEGFQRLAIRAQVAVDKLGIVNCSLGAQVQREAATFLTDTADLR